MLKTLFMKGIDCYNETTLENTGVNPYKKSSDLPKGKILRCPIKPLLKCSSFSLESSLAQLHLMRSGDVAENPGPNQRDAQDPRDPNGSATDSRATSELVVMSYNVRGLNDELKLRHLTNYLYSLQPSKNKDLIVGLQETYIAKEGKLPYLWRGNLAFTAGAGNSCGCITLINSQLNVVEKREIEGRAHVLVLQRSNEAHATYIVANLYAPNPNNAEKISFYEKIFETVAELDLSYGCLNKIILGDFNLIFNPWECKNRLHTNQEKRIANSVKDMRMGLNLEDVWDSRKGFTWRRANSDTFSTIDRILFTSEIKLIKVQEKWALSNSDHAAVIAHFDFNRRDRKVRSRLVRLDPALARDQTASVDIVTEYNEMMKEIPNTWNPHQVLEFAKVCIRTVVEKIQAERKRRVQSEEDRINEELELALGKLAGENYQIERNGLIEYVEQLRAQKAVLIEEKGVRLAQRLGTQWYNEGEKSTRYFLRILNRGIVDDFQKVTDEEGRTHSDQASIEKEVVRFYRDLYEKVSDISTTDEEFFAELEAMDPAEEDSVVRPIRVEELRATLHTCDDTAPGPDGIPYSIIGLLWASFGPILCNAWNYSLTARQLPPSHKTSYLKLIPKAGKDLSKLTNWRPITLSNCDHKLITKTYSKRLCEKASKYIKEKQSAYVKGRIINDNIKSIISTINLSNLEDNLRGLIVSLDAKKAFDSVDHRYIERCLEKFGCSRFIPIFRVLYSELSTDIIINGKVVKGFRILKGVKQGDALSCIIFIMCMEPLLRNIEKNPEIIPLKSEILRKELPKVYAYADDVSCTIADNAAALENIFVEYERLTSLSGLELNADKTEVMRIGSLDMRAFSINYRNQVHLINVMDKIKINGILLQPEIPQLVNANVEAVRKKIDKHLRSWSRRNLSLLGKILIVKTFGISQIIFIMQSIVLLPVHLKALNNLLYKFIWNKHYLAAKAPERIKREIVNKPIKLGGLGMLDISLLDESLKIKSFGRLMVTEHPFLKLIRDTVRLDKYFNPIIEHQIEACTTLAIKLIKSDRDKLWSDLNLNSNRALIGEIRETPIKDIVSPRGQTSLPYFNIWVSGARKIKDLDIGRLRTLARYIDKIKIPKLEIAIACNVPRDPRMCTSLVSRGRVTQIAKCTSKEIRESRASNEPIRQFKIGLDLTTADSLNWLNKISKVTSTKLKSIILRVAHGEVYTMEKLYRFGLEPSNLCPRCQEVETLQHKFIDCQYVNKIWLYTNQACLRVDTDDNATDETQLLLGANKGSKLASLTLRCEVLNRILTLRKDQNYLVHPKTLVQQCIKSVASKERKEELKRELYSLMA